MKKIIFAVLILVFLAGGIKYYPVIFFKEPFIFAHSKFHGLERIEIEADIPELWIEIHDVSPGYGGKKLDEITGIIDKHKKVPSKVVLFVIPNHGNVRPLHEYPRFVKRLKDLKDNGYIIGLHGYAHSTSHGEIEFLTDKENAERLLNRSREEFDKSGMSFPGYFAPPGWRASSKVNDLLLKNFDYIYYSFFIDTPEGILPYHSHEYTTKEVGSKDLNKAINEYTDTRGVFRLTLHMDSVNTYSNLRFLDDFLSSIEDNSSNYVDGLAHP